MLFKLMLGHIKFTDLPYIQLESLFKKLSERQNPDTLFFTCSDSRIVPSLITQANPGDLFVHRNVGNIIPPADRASIEAASTIEYALKILNVQHIIICGHSGCGAMRGLLTPDLDKQLPTVAKWLQHSKEVLQTMHEDGTDLELDEEVKLTHATQRNILAQINHLKTYPLVQDRLAQDQLSIHGWYYDIRTGHVSVYEPEIKSFVSFELAMQETIRARKNKIITAVALGYLRSKANPSSRTEYLTLSELLDSLKVNVQAIWVNIKDEVKQKLWEELGALFEGISDQHFVDLLASGSEVQITDLASLNSTIFQSEGYIQYLAHRLPQSIFTEQAFSMQGGAIAQASGAATKAP